MDLLDIKSRPKNYGENFIFGALLSDNAIEQIMPVSFSSEEQIVTIIPLGSNKTLSAVTNITIVK